MKRDATTVTPASAQRRTLLEWMGRATVLGLASPLVQACGSSADRGADAAGLDGLDGLGHDLTGVPDGGGVPDGADSAGDGDLGPEADLTTAPIDRTLLAADGACAPAGIPEPSKASSNDLFANWNVRTVDEQALVDLLTNWQLRIDGLVATPRTFRFCDLLQLGLKGQLTDFHCVEGWSVYDVPWDGLRLADLLELVQPLASATHVSVGCRGGIYTESLPLAVAHEPKTLLALGVAGHTLPVSHGFPARLVVPRLLGYKNPKYVETLTLADHELVGFWPKYGYPVSGEVPPERLRPGKY